MMRLLVVLSFIYAALGFVPQPQMNRLKNDVVLSAGLFDVFRPKDQVTVGTTNNKSVKKQLDALMKKKKYGILIVSSSVKDSIKVKTLLDDKRVKYKDVELNQEDNGEAIRAEFGVGIWIRGEFIASFNELNKLDKTGGLDDLLKNVPKTTYTTPR